MNTEIKAHIPDELLARLDEIAAREQMCLSLLIRNAIALLIDYYSETNEVYRHSRRNGGVVPSMTFAKYINFKMGYQHGEASKKDTHDECNGSDAPT